MPSPFSRRRPWPWDLRLAAGEPPAQEDVGLLVADELVGRNVQSMGNAVPNSQEYGSSDLYRERSAAFRGPLLGYGEGSQRTQSLSRYSHGENVWISGLWRGKGPHCVLQTPAVGAADGPVLGFIIALEDTATPATAGQAAFALDGRYVVRRTDDSAAGWVESRDGGAGFVHESAARFSHAGAGGADYLYVAGRSSDTDALGEIWRYDGAAWTELPVPGRFLVRLDDRLIRCWGNLTSQCSGDPMVAGNWTGGIRLGDDNDVICGVSAVQGVLYFFARTGRVFTLNGDGTANDLFPGLVKTPPLDPLDAPGGQAAPWLDAIYFRSRDAFYRLTGLDGAVIQEVGPGRLVDNGSVVGGPVQCFAGHQQWYGFLGCWNPAVGDSFLLQLGDWYPKEGGDDPAFQFVDALHGAVVRWVGKRVTAMQTTEMTGPNPRLYAGFSDGTIEYFDLPRTGPNPFAVDAGCTFTERPSFLTWPLHTLLASADRKEYTEVAVYGPRITPGDSVEVRYALDPVLLPLGAPPVLRSGEFRSTPMAPLSRALTAPGDAVEFPRDTFAYGIVLEEHYLTDTTGTIPAYGTPVVSALVLRERLHPKFRLEWTFTVLAGNRLARRDGAPERRSADQLLTHLTRAASDPRTVVLETPYEVTSGFSWIGWTQTLPGSLPPGKRYGTETAVAVDLLAFRTEAIFGTIDRLQDLTIDGLMDRSIDDLGTL